MLQPQVRQQLLHVALLGGGGLALRALELALVHEHLLDGEQLHQRVELRKGAAASRCAREPMLKEGKLNHAKALLVVFHARSLYSRSPLACSTYAVCRFMKPGLAVLPPKSSVPSMRPCVFRPAMTSSSVWGEKTVRARGESEA